MMLIEKLNSKRILSVVIDVRTGEEYRRGHIPGAYSIPLLDETERAEIGILYKKSGRERALERGLEIVAPKLPSIYKAAKKIRDSSPSATACLSILFSRHPEAKPKDLSSLKQGDSSPTAQNDAVLRRDSSVAPLPQNDEQPRHPERSEGSLRRDSSVAALPQNDSTSPHEDIKTIIYCWRGGLRSKFVANILNFMGLSCDTLDGGYKKYRTLVLSQFEKTKPADLLIMDGLTGTGKTALLHYLKSKGFPVIDLEGLASHKGSVFGDVATPPQPTQQQFENALAEELTNIVCTSPILIEGESKRIGFIQIPKPFFDSMTKAQRILVEDSLENRVERIYKDYIEPIPVETLLDRLSKLQKYLGPDRYSSLQSDLNEGRVVKFIEGILTEYYDPAYKRCFQKRITEGEVVSVLPADGDRIIEWLGSQNWSNVADAQPN